MKSLLLSVSWMLSSYLISGSNARADDWGCQVILCLSSPGGPTQYAECRPPSRNYGARLPRAIHSQHAAVSGFTVPGPAMSHIIAMIAFGFRAVMAPAASR